MLRTVASFLHRVLLPLQRLLLASTSRKMERPTNPVERPRRSFAPRTDAASRKGDRHRVEFFSSNGSTPTYTQNPTCHRNPEQNRMEQEPAPYQPGQSGVVVVEVAEDRLNHRMQHTPACRGVAGFVPCGPERDVRKRWKESRRGVTASAPKGGGSTTQGRTAVPLRFPGDQVSRRGNGRPE